MTLLAFSVVARPLAEGTDKRRWRAHWRVYRRQ